MPRRGVGDVLADPELLHLAARGARKVVDLDAVPRAISAVATPAALEVRAHLVERRHRVPGPDPQHRGGALAEPRVGRGHHHGLGDARACVEQHLLDLERADVLAAADDDVGLAVGDGEVAVVVEHADIACAVPAVVVEGLARSVRRRCSRGTDPGPRL